jgi:putative peptidoglycan lipid II flippase
LRRLSRIPNSVWVVLLALGLGALFKLSAFGREAFITARFGLTSVTDAYFALQQFPVTAAMFMFGPFARAFTPAYAEACDRDGRASWLPGLILYTGLIGLACTLLSFLFAQQILHAFTRSDSWPTLAVLAICYVPIVFTGLRTATWNSHGWNLRALTLAGLPYVVMTVALVGMYLAGAMNNLSLALSMSIGFVGVGVFSAIALFAREHPFRSAENILRPWRFEAFKRFTRQLTASSIETIGFSINQFLMLYFMARAGTGAVSANNCATRIGMLGYSLFAQPLVQLLQARLCRCAEADRDGLAKRYISALAVGAALFAVSLFIVRRPLVSLVYLRGNFSSSALEEVLAILPAWLCYFVVLCLNTIISQYMFHVGLGARYTRIMLAGYAGTNILRFAIGQSMGAPWIVWCGVIAEGGAFLANVLSSAMRTQWSPVPGEVVYEKV